MKRIKITVMRKARYDDLIEKYNLEGRIVFTGFVADEDVAVIYKNAKCFVFPTLYEGFGMVCSAWGGYWDFIFCYYFG